jgi:N-acetylglucosaminyl-diphospho-decaprenol L-rhamnosyltransferase
VTVPVSVVIPVFNGRELLETLLDSIARQTVSPTEILVVDNGSSDGAPECARRAGARVIVMGHNAGFAAAVNRGIREAKSEAIAVINSDVELDRRWLELLWDCTQKSGADFATGQILQAGSNQILDGSYDLICRGACSWRAGAGRPPGSLCGMPETIHFCSATASIYRAELFRQIGPFEESFESYLEDVDLGLRSVAANRKGGYFPQAVCWHRGSATFGRWSPRVVRLISRNQMFLIARHYPASLIRRWLWPVLVAHVLWGGLAIRHGCGFAWLSGKLEGLGRWAAMRRASTPSGALEAVILESERQIYELQSASVPDAYWRLYFRLVKPVA